MANACSGLSHDNTGTPNLSIAKLQICHAFSINDTWIIEEH
jgi:hypothetical protein